MKTNFTDKIEVGNDICSLGHIGALCETCDLYNIRGNGTYAVTGNLDCADCSDLIGDNVTIILLISILTIGFIFYSVRSTIQIND